MPKFTLTQLLCWHWNLFYFLQRRALSHLEAFTPLALSIWYLSAAVCLILLPSFQLAPSSSSQSQFGCLFLQEAFLPPLIPMDPHVLTRRPRHFSLPTASPVLLPQHLLGNTHQKGRFMTAGVSLFIIHFVAQAPGTSWMISQYSHDKCQMKA